MNIIEKLNQLPDDPAEDKIKSTAEELKMISFSPVLLVETPKLLYMTKQEIIAEAQRITDVPQTDLPDYDNKQFEGTEDFKEKHLDMLYFNYELLTRLRAGIPEAWDYIHELYEDD